MTVLERVEPRVMGELFALADDSRVASLPGEPVAIEAHVRASGAADLVVGYTNDQLEGLVAWVGDSIAPAHKERWSAFHASIADRVIDAGAQVGAERFQTYVRGRFDAETIGPAFEAAGVAVEPTIARNTMLLFGRNHCEMLGLELGGENDVGGAIYVAVPNRGADDRETLTDAIAFLLDAQLPGTDASKKWHQVAALLLETALEEWIYISMPPVANAAWVKIDVGQRPLARAEVVGEKLGSDVSAMVERARSHQLDPVAHIGVRFSRDAARVSIYGDLTGS